MCFLYTEPEAAREVFHRIMDFQLGIAKHYLKLGVEMAGMGDDLGTQAGLLFSPEILNDFLVPEYRSTSFKDCPSFFFFFQNLIDFTIKSMKKKVEPQARRVPRFVFLLST